MGSERKGWRWRRDFECQWPCYRDGKHGGFWWVFVFLLSLLVSLDTARFPQAKNISLTLFIRLVLVLGLHSIEIEMEIWSGSNIKGEIEKH